MYAQTQGSGIFSNSHVFMSQQHTLTQSKDSVLALTHSVTNDLLFAATQSGNILCWQLGSFKLLQTLHGHSGHVLALAISDDGRFLTSAGDEGIVRLWEISPTFEFSCLAVIHAGPDCGDIHAMAYVDSLHTVYIGCKNASIQFFDISKRSSITKEETLLEWKSRKSMFFHETTLEASSAITVEKCAEFFVIPKSGILEMCHNGFVYSLIVDSLPSSEGRFLFSGSGDGYVKIWSLKQVVPSLVKSIKVSYGSVLALAVRDGILFTGAQDGEVKAWDLETFQCIRTLIGHTDDVLALCHSGHYLFSASADGTIRKWNRNFECTQIMTGHVGSVLCLASSPGFLISGGSDKLVNIWDLPRDASVSEDRLSDSEDRLMSCLKQFVEIPSVSSDPARKEDCRRCAKYLKSLFIELGADAQIVAGAVDHNPLVFGKFSANSVTGEKEPLNVLFYGHYDTQPAMSEKWKFPPFCMTGHDGYLYGRGVTDNKGPILATIFAVSELYDQRKLSSNVYFVIEGEEESDSSGFTDAIEKYMPYFGKIDLILISNSYWIDDESPCLTYGLRGVIHADLKVSSPISEDLHSGVHGGAYDEVLIDLIKLLGSLTDNERGVLITGFNDKVKPSTPEEEESYRVLLDMIKQNPRKPNSVQNLMSRWRHPSLTIHNVQVSGNASNTVIPRIATATVSMRIVPDQIPERICQKFEDHLKASFLSLRSRNKLSITIGKCASWWYVDVAKCKFYKAAATAVETEWGQQPIYIREGGTIPAIPYLEKVFNAAAVHIPLGQASDNAHLPNERMSITNLMAGRRVIKNFFVEIGSH